MRFLDTNVLLYAYSGDAQEATKCAIARELLVRGTWCISAQVLQEFYANAVRVRPGAALMSAAQAQATVARFAEFCTAHTDAKLVEQAIALSQRNQLSYWDAAIVIAAVRCGATELLTEDLNAGQVIEGVRVVNPFA